jgi:hypothetical protein
MSESSNTRVQNYVVAALAVVILGFCVWGFGSKFVELVRLVLSDEEAQSEGIFAVTPVINYLLASLGFLCLFGWATAHDMFRNIEQPKQTMLDTEAMLDAGHDDDQYSKSVTG